MKLWALDNTFGYCSSRQVLSFPLDDKLAIARELDGMGIQYIDAGCPASDEKAREFLARAHAACLPAHAHLVASARVEAIHDAVERDVGIHATLDSGTPAVALSWSCRQSDGSRLQDDCATIREAIRYLKAHAREAIFRAEDFFDSFGSGALCALRMLEAAKSAGADILCLCDSAGSTLPQPLREICAEVRKRFDGILGICAHNDSELAVANTLEAVEQGFTYFEGSIHAYGPRSGSANLCSIISNLEYKLGHTVLGQENLSKMFDVARFVAEAATVPLRLSPHRAGQEQTLLECAGERLLARLTDLTRRTLLDRIQHMEFEGYELRTAAGTVELLVRESLYPELQPFVPEHYETTSHSAPDGAALSSATVTIRVGEHIRCESEEGTGPVDALERCLRQCLFVLYPEISSIELTDYRLQMLERGRGARRRVRVTMEWFEGGRRWATAGVAGDLVQAAWLALVDGFRLPLMRLGESRHELLPHAADASWAV